MVTIKDISKDDFDGPNLKREGLSIVECFSYSSISRHIMEMFFEKLQNQSQFSFSQYRLNTQDNPFVVELFYIIREPTYLFFNNGKLIDKIEGLTSSNALYELIMKHQIQTNNNQ